MVLGRDWIVRRLIGDGNHRVIYGFSVSAAGRLLASGRAAVVLDAEGDSGAEPENPTGETP